MPNRPDQWVRTGDMLVGLALLLLLACAWLVFLPATRGPFLFDDFANLGNLAALNDGVTWRSVGRYLHDFVGNPGRPLAALSFLLEDQAWPTVPGPYKRTNLLLHLLAGVLVFVLARQLGRLDPRLRSPASWIALVATALWLLHPMQLASTMLVVQRMNILATLFSLAGIIAYVACLARRQPRPTLALALLGTAAAIAFLCKENGVLVFAYAAVLNHTLLLPVRARLAPRQDWQLLACTWGPLVLVAAGMAVQSGSLFASYQLRDFTLGERLMTEARVLLDYTFRILVPKLGGQGLFHDDYPVSRGLLTPPGTAFAILFWIAAITLAVAGRKRAPWPSFAVLWFVAGHLLESTVLPLELYFEHRNYLPMLGFIVAAVAMVASAHGHPRRLGIAALVLWLLLAVWSTSQNAVAWGSELRLARIWHAENPRSIRAVQLLARAYESRDMPDLARQTLVDAYERRPEATELAFQLALFDCSRGRLTIERVEDLSVLAATVQPSQLTAAAVRRLGMNARRNACGGALDPAGWHRLTDVLLANAAYTRVGSLAGALHYERAIAAEVARNLSAAMAEYDAAYRYLRDARIPQRQAVLLISAGLPSDALEYLAISDASRRPWPKRVFYDVREENAGIRRFLRQSGKAQDKAHDQ